MGKTVYIVFSTICRFSDIQLGILEHTSSGDYDSTWLNIHLQNSGRILTFFFITFICVYSSHEFFPLHIT